MKRYIALIFSAFILFFVVGCGTSNGNTSSAEPVKTASDKSTTMSTEGAGNNLKGKKVLVAYFSWGGNTRKAAEQIQAKTGGDLFEIRTVKPYPTEYKPTTEVAKKELEDNFRPELASKVNNMADYDVIMIGYPIWWHTAPMAVYTFMETYDLSGKTIIPFCTSGGSDIVESMPAMKQLGAKGTLLDGITIKSESDMNKIEPWLKNLGLIN